MKLLLFVVLAICWPAAAQNFERPDPTGRLTLSDKTRLFLNDSFRPELTLWTLIPAALDVASPPKAYPAKWRQGVGGFARNAADYAAFDVTLDTTKYAVGALLHEDPRYYPSHSRNFFARTAHALAFTLIDRSDGRRNRIAFSNLAAASAAGFVGNAYHPTGFSDVTHGGQQCVIGIATIAAANVYEEFLPELARAWRRLRHRDVKDFSTSSPLPSSTTATPANR